LYLGGEKLRLSDGAIRALFTVLVAGAFLCVAQISAVYAQAGQPDPAGGGDLSVSRDDPIAEAERALSLGEGETTPVAVPAASSLGTVLRMVLTLAVAAAAIYGVIYFIKRASRRAEARDPFLKVLASAHLGANRYAHIVAVGSKAWLVGAAEGGVSLISEIEDADTLNALLLEDSRKSAELTAGRFTDFKAMLRRLGMNVDSGVPGTDSIRKRRERLRGL
jgi:flagellar protein FliO/FliZ